MHALVGRPSAGSPINQRGSHPAGADSPADGDCFRTARVARPRRRCVAAPLPLRSSRPVGCGRLPTWHCDSAPRSPRVMLLSPTRSPHSSRLEDESDRLDCDGPPRPRIDSRDGECARPLDQPSRRITSESCSLGWSRGCSSGCGEPSSERLVLGPGCAAIICESERRAACGDGSQRRNRAASLKPSRTDRHESLASVLFICRRPPDRVGANERIRFGHREPVDFDPGP